VGQSDFDSAIEFLNDDLVKEPVIKNSSGMSRLDMLLRSKKETEKAKRKLRNLLLRTRRSDASKKDENVVIGSTHGKEGKPTMKQILAALALRN